ncbi:MAG TPA: hypothetical protein VN628_00360 [Vicinamibacterales bacterium]|nr:hypothetical protein [Vicinamibacterales bacterium]
MKKLIVCVVALAATAATAALKGPLYTVYAQGPGRDLTGVDAANPAGRGRGPAGKTPKESAPIDLTGYWVSIVSEDWRFRMLTPAKGDHPDFLLTPEATRIADAWDAAKDQAEKDHCKAYGAANIMRVPGRFHITWADDRTLKIDTDAGRQTRLLKFAPVAGPAGPPSRQGTSIASWDRRALRVETSNLLPGYLQYNGVPHDTNLKMVEYFDVISEPGGELWLIDDAVLTDPGYLVRSHKRSTHLRKQADSKGWDPQPCLVK